MMSIESIELDTSGQTGSVHMDKDKIEEEYQKQIATFVSKYEQSELCNNHNEVYPGLVELYNGSSNQNAMTTSFCY